jgi:tRNA-dihydrouridine synthase B
LEGNVKLFLAPLAGITDKSFRRLCRECGAALVYTEMVSAKALWYGDRNTEKLLETCPEEGPVAFQVFGSDPEAMASAAEALDGRENILLDVNMGCPVPKVVKNGDGSALMRDPGKAGRIIEAMCKRTKKPVTAKIRAGWDSDSVNAVEVARALEAAGAAMICVMVAPESSSTAARRTGM